MFRRHLRLHFRFHVLSAVFFLTLTAPFARADWPPIDPADLAMRGIPQQPGAPAVILLRDEKDNDLLHFHSTYERIKILTEAGRDRYSDVELPYNRRSFTIDSIGGRTIHADGSIVNFEGKAFDKTVGKGRGFRYQIKAFTMPNVQVGSIIEFRYSVRYDDHSYYAPEWEVQEELFQKKADFEFLPFQFNSSSTTLVGVHDRTVDGVSWTSYIPDKGHQPKEVRTPRQSTVQLSMTDIPPYLDEPYSPPARAMKWRVNFYYRTENKLDEFWKVESKYWNKDVEGFVNHRNGAAEALGKAILAADTPEQKVKKIYAFVAELENRSYIPARAVQEEKALAIKPNKNAEDVLRQRSGDHDDLNRAFAALVLEAGIPAWMMHVPDRTETFFDEHYLSTRQFDGEIVIVQLSGKEVFLDPGTKYCPYGMLNWRYAGNRGLRQSASKGTELGEAPLSAYNDAMIQRVARLKLTEDGKYEGTVSVGFGGLEALSRRRTAGHTDAEGRKNRDGRRGQRMAACWQRDQDIQDSPVGRYGIRRGGRV